MRVAVGRTVVALANNRKAILVMVSLEEVANNRKAVMAMVSLEEAASKESELQLINQLEV